MLLERTRHLGAAMRQRASSQHERVDALSRSLSALSPLGVLDRGYAVLQRADGQVVRAPNEVEVGERLRARLAKGEIGVDVAET